MHTAGSSNMNLRCLSFSDRMTDGPQGFSHPGEERDFSIKGTQLS